MSYPEERRHLLNHKGHLMLLRPEERHLITPELVKRMTFTGKRDVLRARASHLEEAGYNQLVVQIVEGHEDALDEWASVFF